MNLPISATILLCALTFGCSQPQQTAQHIDFEKTPAPMPDTAETKKMREQLHSVVTADGISADEAHTIAQSYFFRNVGCGGFTGITDGNNIWIVEGAFGYAATPIKGFHIDKQTGKVTSPIGPSYEHPLQILR